jgi:hypothetical protein
MTNVPHPPITGVITTDISDHFTTFAQLPNKTATQHKTPSISKRNITPENLNNFKTSLRAISWNNVLALDNVDDSFNTFWDLFKELYELHFPVTQIRFNRNIHQINKHMTRGLLISRKRKEALHSAAVATRSEEDLLTYRTYRNICNSLLKLSKKLYFENNLQNSIHNPKRTWDLLKEATILNKTQQSIDKIMSNGGLTSDKVAIATRSFHK